jgi:hypothetical protein
MSGDCPMTLKTVHVGGITHTDGTTVTFTSSSRPKLVTEIDNWFTEYFKGLNETILPLPPLDDWDHSHEDNTYWSIKFPITGWTVWTRNEILTFQ